MTLGQAVIQTSRSLDRQAKRAFKLALANMELWDCHLGEDTLPVSRVHAVEYAETYDVKISTARKHLRDAGKRLFACILEYKEDGRGPLKARWIGRFMFEDDGDWLDLQWFPEIHPHLVLLQEKYRFEERQKQFNLKN